MNRNTNFRLSAGLLAGCVTVLLVAGPAPADPPRKIEKKFANGSVLRFYGQINKGFLNYDDGQVTGNYDLIDNNNSNTRFGLTYTSDLGDAWKYLGTIEIQYAPFSTTSTSLSQPSPPSSAYDLTDANIRLIDNKFTSEGLGVFYLGQGDMVSYNTAEVDLSGTSVIARSAVQNIAGGQLLREADGTLSNVSINDAFNNYNGIGRRVRLRYDTPNLAGFSLRGSFGRNLLYTNTNAEKQEAVRNQNLYDLALAYNGESGDFKYEAQAAYSYQDAYTVSGKVTPSIEILDGSASVLHGPTGLNLTVALGQQDNGNYTGDYGYIKGGWQTDLVSWGKTAFAIDYYSGNEINGTGTSSQSTGLSVVQNITDWNTELWATYRTYSYDAATTDYDDAQAIFVGARFKF
jgi:hypothetical protein